MENDRIALLDQRRTSIIADHLKVVASSAARADEMQPKAVDGSLDLVESGECLTAANALEHGSGVRPKHDVKVTVHG